MEQFADRAKLFACRFTFYIKANCNDLHLDMFTNNMLCNFKDKLTFGIIKLCT